ncbi:putative bifunctional diguanylate cyclase/phosphodiesterase [Mangrovihabitans endophyticus]|uniref:Diguanylate cyclase (GGDEF) domain-containing protein n=1 Tax=Mangrovihabitans endophyticus TaxID=1751298 RepID=A0A8J3BZL8_9ACTN|nr:bifunctional diguanylate cyclase/phosphodiesterase [Mangrovihabitans endophyticus]GGK97953.1 hypothetical protein GCM10012284_35240 [Mangrovihabitans endophyticus]
MGAVATQQLADFLTVVAERPDRPGAHRAALECAARALEADVAVLLIDHAIVATVGTAAEELPVFALSEVAAGRRTTVDLDGYPHGLTFATIDGDAPGALLLGRRGESFTAEEVCVLRGMARVLELSLRTLHALESERRRAQEDDHRTDAANDHERLFRHLSGIQRAIANRVPLTEVLDSVTAAAAELLGTDLAALSLVDENDPSLSNLVSAHNFTPEMQERMKQAPIAARGVAGLAVMGNELVAVDDYSLSPIAIPEVARLDIRAVMAAPVHEQGEPVGALSVATLGVPREWDKTARDILQTFAEHISLAITDAKTMEAMNGAFHDTLTGLASRTLFMTRMEGAFSGTHDRVGALVIDLDRFKVVNDALGHAAGDELLKEVARRIDNCLRATDTAARLGGDEFAVLLPGIRGADDLLPLAERIMAALHEPFILADRETYVGVSIGMASAETATDSAQDLMVRTDLAVYQAKKSGKDRYTVFEPAMQADFQAGLQMEADLRRAVVRHEFELRYQPIVHLRTNDITGLEALVRWQHPERGIVPPMDFVPLAEETGLIVPIGEWVLREACHQAAAWNLRRGGRPLSVSVNVSAVQLEQGGVPAAVRESLASSGLPAACLVLEMTESLLVDHRIGTLRQLEELKAIGVRLAIDDFGTGYSSLAYLRQFPFDIIKIDKSFVDDIGDGPTAAALTHGIIQLGQALHLSTIAEGIEHAGQLNELTNDCDLGQGYYFAEPLTEQAMGDLLFPPADES